MISVVIPAYNEGESIKDTIEEIKTILKKNKIYKGSEIIVVNDGSKDNTGLVAKESGAKVINNPTNNHINVLDITLLFIFILQRKIF